MSQNLSGNINEDNMLKEYKAMTLGDIYNKIPELLKLIKELLIDKLEKSPNCFSLEDYLKKYLQDYMRKNLIQWKKMTLITKNFMIIFCNALFTI